ncbi:hypothetical protein QP938_04420 [Porticoccaceae bacterium LTM1]|nr:hypothetical protein QP938_04420 [Porticoccaceae bacterium LTM1]
MTDSVERFEISSSRWLSRYLLISHLLVLLCCWMLPLEVALQWLATGVVIASAIWYWYSVRKNEFHGIQVSNQGWQLLARGEQVRAELLQPCYVSRYLMILNWRLPNRRSYRQLIFSNSVTSDHYRRLRCRLREYLTR